MNPYYRQEVVAKLNLAFAEVYHEIASNPYGKIEPDTVRMVATWGAGLLHEWGINRDIHHVLVNEAMTKAGFLPIPEEA